jgi:hypothetical protein
MTRGLGTREASRPDLLSLLMFEPEYLQRLIEIGEADAQAHMAEIAPMLEAQEDSADIDFIHPCERADDRPTAR